MEPPVELEAMETSKVTVTRYRKYQGTSFELTKEYVGTQRQALVNSDSAFKNAERIKSAIQNPNVEDVTFSRYYFGKFFQD